MNNDLTSASGGFKERGGNGSQVDAGTRILGARANGNKGRPRGEEHCGPTGTVGTAKLVTLLLSTCLDVLPVRVGKSA